MTFDDLVKKHNIKKIYVYKEISTDNNTTMFGWTEASSLNYDEPLVLSSSSKAKSVTEKDKEWAMVEGNSLATLSDYGRYFVSLTGDTPEAFSSKWASKPEELELYREASRKSYREGEGSFLLKLAGLIENGDKFIEFGRIYKLVNIST